MSAMKRTKREKKEKEKETESSRLRISLGEKKRNIEEKRK